MPVPQFAKPARLAALLGLAVIVGGIAGCGRRADPEPPGVDQAAKPAGGDSFGAALPTTKSPSRGVVKPKTPFLLDPLL